MRQMSGVRAHTRRSQESYERSRNRCCVADVSGGCSTRKRKVRGCRWRIGAGACAARRARRLRSRPALMTRDGRGPSTAYARRDGSDACAIRLLQRARRRRRARRYQRGSLAPGVEACAGGRRTAARYPSGGLHDGTTDVATAGARRFADDDDDDDADLDPASDHRGHQAGNAVDPGRPADAAQRPAGVCDLRSAAARRPVVAWRSPARSALTWTTLTPRSATGVARAALGLAARRTVARAVPASLATGPDWPLRSDWRPQPSRWRGLPPPGGGGSSLVPPAVTSGQPSVTISYALASTATATSPRRRRRPARPCCPPRRYGDGHANHRRAGTAARPARIALHSGCGCWSKSQLPLQCHPDRTGNCHALL